MKGNFWDNKSYSLHEVTQICLFLDVKGRYWFRQGYNTLWPSYLKPELANDPGFIAETLITEVNINDHGT